MSADRQQVLFYCDASDSDRHVTRLALLDRVMLRLVACDSDEALEAQLGTLLCPILLKGATPDPAVQAKVFSVLSHVNEVRRSGGPTHDPSFVLEQRPDMVSLFSLLSCV